MQAEAEKSENPPTCDADGKCPNAGRQCRQYGTARPVSAEKDLDRCLTILSCPGDWPEGRLRFPAEPVPIVDGPVGLAAEVDHAEQRFYWRQGGKAWKPLGTTLDASALSDEGGRGEHASFTGTFVDMSAFGVSGLAATADFASFRYVPKDA